MAEILTPEKIKGKIFEFEVKGKKGRALVTDVSIYYIYPEPDKPVRMYNIVFSGVVDNQSIGPWTCAVETAKATTENIKLAIRDTVLTMLGMV